MVESSYSVQFRIKHPSKKAPGSDPETHISDIANDFVDKDSTGLWGGVLCVKYDDLDKYVGASYMSGGLKILNSFSGKLVQTLFPPANTG